MQTHGRPTNTTIEYLLNLPVNRLEEVEDLLRSKGIYFDRRKHMVAINEAFRDQSAMALGQHVPEMIQSINGYLKSHRLRPTIPEDHQDWDPNRYYRFLQFALEQFSWNGAAVEDAWWQQDGMTWTDVAREHMGIFRESQEKKSQEKK